jgi:hypothetical protein
VVETKDPMSEIRFTWNEPNEVGESSQFSILTAPSLNRNMISLEKVRETMQTFYMQASAAFGTMHVKT